MLQRIKRYIEKQKLLPDNSSKSTTKIIIGLSGGADSVVLLHILNRLGYNCIAAHCNFHLRGEESLRDEELARAFAIELNIPFTKIDFNTIEYSKKNNISIEMAARNLRYEWFEKIKIENNADYIAVAHHSDDNVETFLLNMIRGTGIKGLTGISPKNGHIIRPLLNVSKEDIINYAQSENISYAIDSTNLEDEYTRNKIRLNILPLLRTINPSVSTSILNSIENLTEVDKIYNKEINNIKEFVFDKEKHTIDIDRLKEAASPEAVLFEILKEYQFDRDTIKNIAKAIDSQSGKEFYSPEHILIKDRNKFFIKKQDVSDASYPLNLQTEIKDISEVEITKDNNIAYFDYDKLKLPLTMRRWQAGDKFVPFGMTGFQKLSDYFNNNKFNKFEKENTWLLCSGEDIIWIVGHRTDNRYRLNKTSQRAYIIKLL
ncbi:tRNA(Ile)-lysidine synthase [Dysgonomonadaceae bacterium PH5-43]|nr:tRNA(Ile)-lysidine synthase [Dysgonomonadaceae bacterium PH5-43]